MVNVFSNGFLVLKNLQMTIRHSTFAITKYSQTHKGQIWEHLGLLKWEIKLYF